MYLIAKVDESGTRLSFRIYVSRESTFEPPKSQSKPKTYQLILEKSKVESITGKLGHFFEKIHINTIVKLVKKLNRVYIPEKPSKDLLNLTIKALIDSI